MGRTIVTVFTDDLTGESGGDIAAHSFSVDGVGYEIDLTPENHQKLLAALEPFVRAARKGVGPRKARATRTNASAAGSSTGPHAAQVREWARNQGMEISRRGLIRQDIVDRYEKAMNAG
jgi:hypothetical protein